MKRDYLSRLSRAARWYLPPAEAAEVLEDYREIMTGRNEEELRRDLGTPRAAMRQLARPKVYRRWLGVFAFLSALVLLPMVDEALSELSQCIYHLWGAVFFLNGFTYSSRYLEALLPVGIAVSLVWFQRNGQKGQGLPKRAVPLFLLVLLGMAWVWFITWVVLTLRFDVIDFLFPSRTWLVHLTLLVDVLIAGLAGMTGLMKARLGDRRWRAVYVWGLTGITLNVFLWKFMTSMNLTDGFWQGPYWLRLVFITLLGLIGTAVSLC